MLERRYAMSGDMTGLELTLGSALGGGTQSTCTCSMCMQTFQALESRIAADSMRALPEGADPVNPEQTLSSSTPVELGQTFKLHSNPNAKHWIYLDFNGHVTSGTIWNSTYTGGSNIVSPAYDIDGNPAAFSDQELRNIQFMWERVAEDFLPFDVNVTTEEPPLDKLIKSGTGDTEWGVRVVIGGSSNDWLGQSAGGYAYIGSFNWNSDTPAFVFPAQLGGGNEKYTAECISHEIGHTLGLSHDGRTSPVETYFQGHGSGTTGWAPIMGSAYFKNVTQWSKGDYANSDNKQDDLAIITTQNGFGYRADDHGNTQVDASLLNFTNGQISDWGIISQSTDVDVFTFYTGAGTIQINANPLDRGPNLDIKLELLDAAYNVLTTINPSTALNASLTWTATAAQYFLRISGDGTGDPATNGYSNYASLGQYFLSGTLVTTSNDYLAITAIDTNKAEGNPGTTSQHTFKLERSGNLSGWTTVNYSVVGTGSSPANASDFVGGVLPSGTYTFAPGENAAFISFEVVGDLTVEANESFLVQISTTSPTTLITTNPATGSILNDDAVREVKVTPTEGLKTSESRGGSTSFTVTLSAAPTANVTISVQSSNTAEGTVSTSLLTFTPTNWNTPQTVTVRGVDDSVVDGDVQYTILLGRTQSADVNWNGLAVSSVSVVNVDNDTSNSGSNTKGGPKKGAVIEDSPLAPVQEGLRMNRNESLQEQEPEIIQTGQSVQTAAPWEFHKPSQLVQQATGQTAVRYTDVTQRVQEKLDAIDAYFADLGL